jgi:hypothetical protein
MKIEVTGGERVPEQHGSAKRKTWIKDKFPGLALKIHDFRNTEGLAMVQIRYRGGFETKSEAFT